ncbi:MAG: hypothetical protein LDL41_22760 [Coleofasciculus sp. S288]|nr:hypothetical protein [Coleofasciculus sp. S288]
MNLADANVPNHVPLSASGIPQRLEDFEIFPKHVGVWLGEWIRLDAGGKEIERFTGIVTKKILDNQWIQSNTYQWADGRSVTYNFVGVVVSDRTVKLESSQPPFCDYLMIAEEYRDNLVIFRIWDRTTGVPLLVEVIHLSDENTCVRTNQGFTPEGTLKSFTAIAERRIG